MSWISTVLLAITRCRSSHLSFQRISNCQQQQYSVETILALLKVRISCGWEGLPM